MKNNGLLSAVSWNIFAKLFAASLGFIAIPIFTHLLTTSEYGIYSLYITWLGMFVPIMSLGLHLSIARAKVEFKNKYSQYVSSIMFLVFLLFLIELPLFFFFKSELSALTGLANPLLYILIFQSVFAILLAIGVEFLRYQQHYIVTSIIDILQPIFAILLSVMFIYYQLTPSPQFGRILGLMIPNVLSGILLAIMVIAKGKQLYSANNWKYGLTFSMPLIIGSLAFIMNGQFDRILINKYIGSSETGIYSFAYSIGMLLMFLGNASKQAINPWIYEKLDSKKIVEARFINFTFIKVITFFAILLLYVSPELIKVMAPESFQAGGDIIPYVLLGAFFQQLMTVEITNIMFLKKNKWYSLISIVGVTVNILLNIIFIPLSFRSSL